MIKDLEDFFVLLNDRDRPIYEAIAKIAYELGYKAKRAKTQGMNYVFISNKTKKSLLKFSYQDGIPELKMKYYASKNYSALFHEGVRNVIEEFNYKYTGCYGCGKCKDEPEGYVYEYPDGRRYFRCGFELICLPSISTANIPEIVSLLKTQHEHYLKSI